MGQSTFVVHLLGYDSGPRTKNLGGRLVDKLLEISHATTIQRLIWAPETLFENPLHPNSVIVEANRDPNKVLEEFGEFRDGDSLSGDPLEAFIDDLVRRCRQKMTPARRTGFSGGENEQIYVLADKPDQELVYQAARILTQHYRKKAYPCAFEGAPDRLREHHEKHLREANAVLFCWGETTNAWISNFSEETADIAGLGRNERFAATALLPCTPQSPIKTNFFSPDISLPLPMVETVNEQSLKPFVDSLEGGT